MVNNNQIPIEVNKKPFETVYEIKNETQSVVGDQIPSFEEFMESYEGDERVNESYSDEIKSYGDMGMPKNFDPCYTCSCYNSFSIVLKSEWGADHQYFFGIPLNETPKRSIDPFSDEARTFISSITTNCHNMSGIWQSGYMRIGIRLDNTDQAEELLRHFASGNLKVRGRGNVHHRGAENVIVNTVRTALSSHRGGRDVNIDRSF